MSRRGKPIRKDGQRLRKQTDRAAHHEPGLEPEHELDAAFQAIAGDHLDKWDASITPDIPTLDSLETMISSHKEAVRQRLWRDLLLFWAVGCLILTVLMFVLYSSLQAFLFLQIGTFAAAVLFLLRASFRKEGRRKWTH
ncbi:YxlC family protein [Paenibacillus oenotherae]|uniref:YxlC family protein n=1 Tax=Paenibacillus oenotherae TaxID=1435645 RepID=A0ABS7D8Z1_9BACL|nr:YxlC family protein [Paenibacillus oenotherae]MBW7476414.1 YxlC family protein [Paenibacillus oenotherae]